MEEPKFPMELDRNTNGCKPLGLPAEALMQEPACHLLLEKIPLGTFTTRLLPPSWRCHGQDMYMESFERTTTEQSYSQEAANLPRQPGPPKRADT